jgi:hypothetical protein
MGEARRRQDDRLIDDASEFELEVSSRSMNRLQLAVAKAGAAEDAARAAQAVAMNYQSALREAIAQMAEAGGYEMPQNYEMNLDTKTNTIKVTARQVDEQGRLIDDSGGVEARQNGQVHGVESA